MLDTETGVLEYSNAGHIPAVLAGPEPGQTAVLTGAASVPLAVRREQPRPQASQVLPPGSMLMVYTDGLVERRNESIDDGISRAASILVGAMTSPLDTVPETVVRALAPASGYDDDVAMVVYRHRPTKLRIEIEAVAGQLAVVRHRLAAWLQAAGVPDELAPDIVLVVNEACTNCAEHAYRGHTEETMLLEAEVSDRQVRTRITDAGSWKTPAGDPGNSGRGLVLMRALSDTLEIQGTTTGTTVDIGFQLPAEAK
ncbi:MAG: ATP-binding protein [Trebonia sp.]